MRTAECRKRLIAEGFQITPNLLKSRFAVTLSGLDVSTQSYTAILRRGFLANRLLIFSGRDKNTLLGIVRTCRGKSLVFLDDREANPIGSFVVSLRGVGWFRGVVLAFFGEDGSCIAHMLAPSHRAQLKQIFFISNADFFLASGPPHHEVRNTELASFSPANHIGTVSMKSGFFGVSECAFLPAPGAAAPKLDGMLLLCGCVHLLRSLMMWWG